MFEVFILILGALVLAALTHHAKPVIQTAEQAVLRFQAARHEHFGVWPDEQQRKYAEAIGGAGALSVRKIQPGHYGPAHWRDNVPDAEKNRIFGKRAAAANCGNAMWHITYDTPNLGGVSGYLDGMSGEILYIHAN